MKENHMFGDKKKKQDEIEEYVCACCNKPIVYNKSAYVRYMYVVDHYNHYLKRHGNDRDYKCNAYSNTDIKYKYRA